MVVGVGALVVNTRGMIVVREPLGYMRWTGGDRVCMSVCLCAAIVLRDVIRSCDIPITTDMSMCC